MKRILRIDDLVSIYEDPITCAKLEGKARLIETIREDDGDGLSLWYVQFDDENEVVRTVNSKAA